MKISFEGYKIRTLKTHGLEFTALDLRECREIIEWASGKFPERRDIE